MQQSRRQVWCCWPMGESIACRTLSSDKQIQTVAGLVTSGRCQVQEPREPASNSASHPDPWHRSHCIKMVAHARGPCKPACRAMEANHSHHIMHYAMCPMVVSTKQIPVAVCDGQKERAHGCGMALSRQPNRRKCAYSLLAVSLPFKATNSHKKE